MRNILLMITIVSFFALHGCIMIVRNCDRDVLKKSAAEQIESQTKKIKEK